MRFEEALEAMRKGKKARRARWSSSSSLWIDKESGEMYTGDKPCYRSLSFEEITADDWVVIPDIPSGVIKAVEETPLTAHVNIDNASIRKLLKQQMFTKIPIEPGVMYQLESEDETMYNNLEITFKSGNTIAYHEGEWDDYSFDGKAVAVKKNGAWIGIYNFDNVFCVELKK